MSSREERLMCLALAQGAEALENGEIPVGCVFVKCGTEEVLARGANKTNELRSGCSHAELVAINDYIVSMGGAGAEDFVHCELFVTCEPCIMCAAAISTLGIQKVFFGCHNERFGGNGSILSIHQDSLLACQRPYPVTSGLLKDEAISLFQRFYSLENRRAPPEKRKKRKKDEEVS